jgi:hypothetical protein
MILNMAGLLLRLRYTGAIPMEAKLLTWECMTTFDEIPAQAELERMFEMEFPRTSRRLQECGGFYRIWHLVSFNSSEGRRSRFLVALVEKPVEKRTFEKITFEKISRRVLPEQIWLSAAADQAIRKLHESDNAGNYLCYAHAEGRLFVLVFFEGRLCHWSEDFVGGHAKLELALSRFRRFLESDALFSRAEHFQEIALQGDFTQGIISQDFSSQALFKRASRDSFWRWHDLRKPEVKATTDFAELVGAILGRKTCWLLILALAMLLGKFGELGAKLKSDLQSNVADVVPPELSVPEISMLEVSAEENLLENLRQFSLPRERKRPCILPEIILKGVVGEMFAVVTVAGESKEISAGDSLGLFEVRTVGRDQITLACGDSTVVKKVGAHGP